MQEEKKTQPEISEIDTIKKERDEYLDGWKRAKADFVNYKKDEIERAKRTHVIIKEIFISDILPVLDSFELGIGSVADEQSKKGMELIRMQLEEVMRRHGLEKIIVIPGDTFDPMLHEAIEEVVSEYPEGTIVCEVGAGYKLDGKVLRPSKVKISGGAVAPPEEKNN